MRFFNVKYTFFNAEAVYPFRIFMYDHERKIRSTALEEDSELPSDRLEMWQNFELKGATLQIHEADIEDFFHSADVSQEDFEKENSVYFKCCALRNKRAQEISDKLEQKFDIKDELKFLEETKSFMPIIDRVRVEVLNFPLNRSQEVSLCTSLVEKLFIKETLPVKVAALSYFIAKANNIKDEQVLADIILAALFRDIGHTMLNKSFLIEMKDILDNSFYLKHPMLSIYVLSKTGIEFNKNIKRYILEHHELADGTGFPRQKKETHTSELSYMIQIAEELVKKVSSKEMSVQSCLWAIRNQKIDVDLNTKYTKNLADSMLKLIKLEENT